jgi:hypothetical protein
LFPRAEQETVAESVAYVVLAHHGLDSGERRFPYIATWARDRKVLQHAMSTIQKVSATLIDGVQQQEAEPTRRQGDKTGTEEIWPH